MPNNLACIGFDIQSNEEFASLAENAARFATKKNSSYPVIGHGFYLHWYDKDREFGPELWVRLIGETVRGMMPYFRGKSRRSIGVVQLVEQENYSALDSAYYGWSNPETPDCDSGDYPLVFDTVSVLPQKEFPFTGTFALTGFAQSYMEVFEDEAAFDARIKAEDDLFSQMASQSFIPVGLFVDEGASPQPFAVLSGRVLETKVMRNSLDPNQEFTWALVETVGGPIDIVTYDGFLPRALAAGNYLIGEFWLAADIISE